MSNDINIFHYFPRPARSLFLIYKVAAMSAGTFLNGRRLVKGAKTRIQFGDSLDLTAPGYKEPISLLLQRTVAITREAEPTSAAASAGVCCMYLCAHLTSMRMGFALLYPLLFWTTACLAEVMPCALFVGTSSTATDNDDGESDLTCCLCLEIFHQCVSALPCLHKVPVPSLSLVIRIWADEACCGMCYA